MHASNNIHTAQPVDWLNQLRLALTLGVATAIGAVLAHGHVAESTFIVGAIVFASAFSWARVLRAPIPASHSGVHAFDQAQRLRRGYCRREQVTLHRVAAHRA